MSKKILLLWGIFFELQWDIGNLKYIEILYESIKIAYKKAYIKPEVILSS